MGVISGWCLEPSAGRDGAPGRKSCLLHEYRMPALAILPFVQEQFIECMLHERHYTKASGLGV